MSSPTYPSPKAHSVLILPFTHDIYLYPNPLLPIIFKALTHSSLSSLTILFSTPSSSQLPHDTSEQLYARLRTDPRKHWAGFQTFLGKIYATLAAAQWECGRVLMDVEVVFDGEGVSIDWLKGKEGQCWVIKLEGYELHPLSSSLRDPRPMITTFYTLPAPLTKSPSSLPAVSACPGPSTVAMGGTFDHLHAAHKLLLHLALFLSTRKLIVGVMSDSLLTSKSNAPLVEPLQQRIQSVEAFLRRHGASKSKPQERASGVQVYAQEGKAACGVEMDVLEIHDPLGPTGTEADIQALVVSRETYGGGETVNRTRKERGLPELDMFVIDVIASSLAPRDDMMDDDGEVTEPDMEEAKHAEDADTVGKRGRRERVRVDDGDDVKTLDLSGEMDEKRLKELKMGSTAIRQWIADHER